MHVKVVYHPNSLSITYIDIGRTHSIVADGKYATSLLPFEAFGLMVVQLFYKSGRLRIAIPTANFIDYDWRDIENVRTI